MRFNPCTAHVCLWRREAEAHRHVLQFFSLHARVCVCLQVMAKQFDTIRCVASGMPKFSKQDAFVAITGILDKVRLVAMHYKAGKDMAQAWETPKQIGGCSWQARTCRSVCWLSMG